MELQAKYRHSRWHHALGGQVRIRTIAILSAVFWTVTATAKEPTDAEWAEAFEPYDIAMARGNATQAADALVELIQGEDKEAFRPEALHNLGDLLLELDLPYGALSAYAEALSAGEKAPIPAVNKAIKVAESLGDLAILEPIFGQNVGLEVSGEARASMAWLAARQNFRDGNLGTTLGILALIQKDSKHFVDAQHLKGVVNSIQGRYTDALAPLMTAAAMAEDPETLDLIHLNLARAYYGAANYPRAIEYFAKVQRGSPHWLEAQMERAWAHFRLEDVSGSVSLLLTHLAPWFESHYLPEAHLLQTYSLFLLCKFPTANEEIEAFRSKYLAVNAQLEAALMRSDNASIFKQTAGLRRSERTDIPAQMLVPYLTENRFLKAANAVEKAEEDLQRLRNVSANPFSAVVMDWVKARRDSLIDSEGARIKTFLQFQANALGTMLADTEIARLDILRLETKLYEQAATLGEMEKAKRLAQRKMRVPRGHQRWAFQGEYWADELGYFRVTAQPVCPSSLIADTERR